MKSIGRFDVPVLVGVGIGLTLSGITVLFHLYLARFEHGDGLVGGFVTPWAIGGTFLLGALPGYVAMRYRLRSPALIAGGAYAVSFFVSASDVIDSEQSAGAGLTTTLFDLLLIFWFLPLAGALLLGGIEYGLRRWIVGR